MCIFVLQRYVNDYFENLKIISFGRACRKEWNPDLPDLRFVGLVYQVNFWVSRGSVSLDEHIIKRMSPRSIGHFRACIKQTKVNHQLPRNLHERMCVRVLRAVSPSEQPWRT